MGLCIQSPYRSSLPQHSPLSPILLHSRHLYKGTLGALCPHIFFPSKSLSFAPKLIFLWTQFDLYLVIFICIPTFIYTNFKFWRWLSATHSTQKIIKACVTCSPLSDHVMSGTSEVRYHIFPSEDEVKQLAQELGVEWSPLTGWLVFFLLCHNTTCRNWVYILSSLLSSPWSMTWT